MTRRIVPTTLLDECNYRPLCPFNCPLALCVKEYPGGADGFHKDALIKALMSEGKTLHQIAGIMQMSVSAVERRYNSAHFINVDPTQALPVR